MAMKYCPNPVCPHRLRTRQSAECRARQRERELMTTSRGGTGYVVAIDSFVYGAIRLSRGLDARKATRR